MNSNLLLKVLGIQRGAPSSHQPLAMTQPSWTLPILDVPCTSCSALPPEPDRSLGQDGAPRAQPACAPHCPHAEGTSSGCAGAQGRGLSAAPALLGGPGPSISSGPGIRPLLWVAVTASSVNNRRKKGLGPWRGQSHAQGIIGWKPRPAQRKFQGNGGFSPVYI